MHIHSLKQSLSHTVIDYPFVFVSDDEDYKESNLMHGINGYLYANLPSLEMCLGETISWHVIGLGNEVDMHTAYFYGNTFTHQGSVRDTVSLLPGTHSLGACISHILRNVLSWNPNLPNRDPIFSFRKDARSLFLLITYTGKITEC